MRDPMKKLMFGLLVLLNHAVAFADIDDIFDKFHPPGHPNVPEPGSVTLLIVAGSGMAAYWAIKKFRKPKDVV